ncbi:hypothetical protein VTK73DRAFT_2716 [Phialemonium thermophilum]|uniref:Uncharacterized protein n=1 Tax=Phialemonium thermophilum TaxID=223376 RepID=A0ABR3X3J6_9PEZI
MTLASALGNLLATPFSWITGLDMEPEGGSGREEPYEPSISDVFVVRAMLSKALALPPELVNDVLDWAEYWPHATVKAEYEGGEKIARGGSGRPPQAEDVFLIRSLPLGFSKLPDGVSEDSWTTTEHDLRGPLEELSIDELQHFLKSPSPLLEHPCRKIVFTLRSRDQGWGGEPGSHGTYLKSWTWFDAGFERLCRIRDDSPSGSAPEPALGSGSRKPPVSFEQCRLRPLSPPTLPPDDDKLFDHPLLPDPARKVQANVVAKRQPTEHRVTWSWRDDVDPDSTAAMQLEEAGRGRATGNGEFVRALRLGDTVTLWAHARFPGWINFVEKVQIDVYWAV